jgi:hypothetical protein
MAFALVRKYLLTFRLVLAFSSACVDEEQRMPFPFSFDSA